MSKMIQKPCIRNSYLEVRTMRSFLVVVSLITLSIILSACASQDSVEIQCDEFYENPHIKNNIEVKTGDEFVVSLCSNASTGFRWMEMAEISDTGVLEQIDHKYNGPSKKGDPLPPGTPGSQMWTFKVLKEGTSTLAFEYSRDWDGGEKAAWTFVLTVTGK